MFFLAQTNCQSQSLLRGRYKLVTAFRMALFLSERGETLADQVLAAPGRPRFDFSRFHLFMWERLRFYLADNNQARNMHSDVN